MRRLRRAARHRVVRVRLDRSNKSRLVAVWDAAVCDCCCGGAGARRCARGQHSAKHGWRHHPGRPEGCALPRPGGEFRGFAGWAVGRWRPAAAPCGRACAYAVGLRCCAGYACGPSLAPAPLPAAGGETDGSHAAAKTCGFDGCRSPPRPSPALARHPAPPEQAGGRVSDHPLPAGLCALARLPHLQAAEERHDLWCVCACV